MPKEGRKLGADRTITPMVFQGVVAPEDFPKAKLDVSLDEILEKRLTQTNESAKTSQIRNSEFAEVNVELIDVSEFQPRLQITEEELELLATSISVAKRVNRPILVRAKNDGRFELIGGERRWRAVKSLGWKTITARIVEIDDGEAEVLALTDNEGQEALSDFERGRAYQSILERGEITSIRNLASKVGVSHQSVMRCLKLAKLPLACTQLLSSHPRALGSKLAADYAAIAETHPDLVVEAIKKIVDQGISQEQGLRWLRQQTAAQSGTRITPERSITLNYAGYLLTLQKTKTGLQLSVPKELDIDEVQALITRALESV